MQALDVDCLKHLVAHLGGQDAITLAHVNKSWNHQLLSSQSDPLIWKFLCQHQFNFTSQDPQTPPPHHFRRKWCHLRDWRKSPKSLEEHITIPAEESRGVIQFVHGFGFGLKVATKKISYSWPVEWDGSLIRYYLRGHRLGDCLLEDINKVQCLLNEGLIDASESLESQFWSFLRLFQAGPYLLRLHYSPDPHKHYPPFLEYRYLKGGFNYSSSPSFEEGRADRGVDPALAIRTDFYDYNNRNKYHIIPTQAPETINPQRVEHYKRNIQRRNFPIILALQVNSDDFYILDGHHKYLAYKEMKIFNPVVLSVQPLVFLDQSSFMGGEWNGPYVKYVRECLNWRKGVGILDGEVEEEEFVRELHEESLEMWKKSLGAPLRMLEKIGYSEAAEPVVFKAMYLPPLPPRKGEEEEETEEYVEEEEPEEENDGSDQEED